MKVALDKIVWQDAQRKATTYGVNDEQVHSVLNGASSPQTKSVMKTLLTPPATNTRQASSAGSHERQNTAPPRGTSSYTFDPEDLFRDIFEGWDPFNPYPSGGQRQTPPPRSRSRQPHERPRPKVSPQEAAVVEAKTIAGKAAAADKGSSWLLNEDPQNIVRVIRTVRKARETAADKGENLTDRQIYIRYRRPIDSDDFDRHSKEGQRLEKSFKILSALMIAETGKTDEVTGKPIMRAGDPRGKLPF